jgi:hypothetical protein
MPDKDALALDSKFVKKKVKKVPAKSYHKKNKT